MEMRIGEFVDKLNYVNWMWSLSGLGVPMRITFEMSKAWSGNTFCENCINLFDTNYNITKIKVDNTSGRCTLDVIARGFDCADMPSKSTVFTGAKYDKTFKQLMEATESVRSAIVEDALACEITVVKVHCDFDAIASAINWKLAQRVYAGLDWGDAHELAVPVKSADLTYNRVPVYDMRTGDYRLLKPIFQLEYTPCMESQPTRGSLSVKIEHSMCKDRVTSKSIRVAIANAVKDVIEQHDLEIENTFVYLGD